jgi:hypothetical protein
MKHLRVVGRVIASYLDTVSVIGIVMMLLYMPAVFCVVALAWLATGIIGFFVFRVQYPLKPLTEADTATATVFAVFGPAGLAVSIWFFFHKKKVDRIPGW